MSRDYRQKPIDNAIAKAKAIPRDKALDRVQKKKHDRVVFAITYDPRLPPISKILKKHHTVLTEDPAMKQIFPHPPMVAYRRLKSLRDKLVKAKVPNPPTRSPRELKGMSKCTRVSCVTCPFVVPSKEVVCSVTNKKFPINSAVSCKTSNVIYCITCDKCKEQYIGTTEKPVSERFAQHRGYVNKVRKKKENNEIIPNEKLEATGVHFNLSGHSISNMQITVLEKIFTKNKAVRLVREEMFIKEFQSEFKGINRR